MASKKNGGKKSKIRKLKGGTGESAASKIRGGYGAERPNFGKAGRSKGIRAVGGR